MLWMTLVFLTALILGGMAMELVDDSQGEKVMDDFCKIECR